MPIQQHLFLFIFTLIAILITNISHANESQSVSYSPYVDLTINTHWNAEFDEMEPLDLFQISQQTGIKHFRLAFITDAEKCLPAWGGQKTYSISTTYGSRLIKTLRDHAIDYTLSFGGASGNDISKYCSETDLVSIYENLIKKYQPQGLDFDIENGSADVSKLMNALKEIQSTYPDIKLSFTLPTLPEGLVSTDQNIIRLAKAANLNYAVNIMAMDYGFAYTEDMGEYAKQAATNLFIFLQDLYPNKSDAELWKMIILTPMIGVNDVQSETFTLKNADAIRLFANEHNIGGLSQWSLTRDIPCANQWASPICSGNNVQSKPYEFSQHFMGN